MRAGSRFISFLRQGVGLVLLFPFILFPFIAAAQKVEQLQYNEPGDKITYNITVDGKTSMMEQLYTAVTDDILEGVQKFSDVTTEFQIEKPFQVRKSFCLTSSEGCAFSPGVPIIQLPLEIDGAWTSAYTVTGKNFVNDATQERKVEKIEKVTVPGGVFECFRIARTGRFTGRNNKGKTYSGTEEGIDWVSVIRGKAVLVKAIYKNSFGRQAVRELVSTTFR